jgi:ABC-type bacteriocin/lantibiotic exporter with double-glycine peptidase domain
MLGIASRVVATGCLMWIRCPQMLYRALLFAVLAAPFVVVMQRAVNDLAHKGHRAMRVSGRTTNEMLRNLSTVREFAREAQESEAYARTQTNHSRDSMKLRLLQHLQWPIFISVFFAGQLFNLYAGAELVNAGVLTSIEV